MTDCLMLPKRHLLAASEAIATVQSYMSECPAVIDLYDRMSDGPHDDLTQADLLSLNALNAFYGGATMNPMTAMWVKRRELTPLVGPITKTHVENLTREEMERTIPLLGNALRFIDEVPGFGSTASSKLLRQLRPNVGAIWDSKVGRWYSDFADASWEVWIRQVYMDVLHPQNLAVLLTIQQMMPFRAPLLRIWDILLWMTPLEEQSGSPIIGVCGGVSV